MSDNFEAEIKKLAGLRAGEATQGIDMFNNGENAPDLGAVLDEFIKISQRAADIYNNASDFDQLKVYELSPDFLEIFLGIGGRKGGFSIVSSGKLAVFFDEDPDIVTIIGKFRSQSSGLQANANKTLKLMQVTYNKAESGIQYKDNTGNKLTLEAVLTAVLGWLTS